MNPLDKSTRRAIIDPLVLLLKSRRVLVAIVSLLVGLLISAVPALAPVYGELLVLLITLALALIGGYSIEDAAVAARQQPTDPDVRDQLQTLLDAILDTTLLNLGAGPIPTEEDATSASNIESTVPENTPNTVTG